MSVVITSPALQLQFFGVFGLLVDGIEVKGVPRPAQELLARLVQAGTRGADRVALAADIWPESDAERAQFYLRRCLTQTRAMLGAHRSRLIPSDDRSITLNLEGCPCDLLDFASAGKAADSRTLEQAAANYKGDFLAGHRSEWARHTRVGYRDKYTALLCRLSELAQEAGDYDSALDWLKRAMGADPLREETCRSLMRLLGQNGDFAGIAHAFRDLRVSLRQTLGLSPSRETVELYRELLAGARLLAPARSEEELEGSASANRLPTPVGQFIGREPELAALTEKVSDCRLVTLTGLGGVGKSRLAIQCAGLMGSRFTAGVLFADMSVCGSPEDVGDRIDGALGLSEANGSGRLGEDGSGQTLLVLDEVEHVAGKCADVLSKLLRGMPNLHVLCTSRVPLQSAEEHVMLLQPMRLPPPNVPQDDETASTEAVTFFLSCATRAAPSFKAGPGNLGQVVELCRRLDGLPLALELAAVRLRTLPVGDILVNLDHPFRFLNVSRETGRRHRTLEGVLDWSFQLLPALEQSLFVRLGIFPSTWTVADAQAICSDSRLDRSEVPGALGSLVDHSLIFYDADRGVYRMLETVRSYSQALLAKDSGLLDELQSRHADHYIDSPLIVADSHFDSEKFKADQPNHSAAIEYFLNCESIERRVLALRFLNRLFPCWYLVGAVSDGLRMSLRVVEAFPNLQSEAMTETLFRAAGAAHWLYKMDLADQLYGRAEAMADGLGFEAWSAESLRGRGELAANEGRLDEAEKLLGDALERFEKTLDPVGQADCLGALGYVKRLRGQFDLARELTEGALAVHTRIGNLEGRLWCVGSLAAIHLFANAPEKAAPLFAETLAHQEKAGNRQAQAWNLTMLGITYCALGDYQSAETYISRALSMPGLDAEDLRKTWPMVELGEVHRRAGRLELAEATLVKALGMGRASGSSVLESRALLRLGRVAVDRGDMVSARAYRSAAAERVASTDAQDLIDDLRALTDEVSKGAEE